MASNHTLTLLPPDEPSMFNPGGDSPVAVKPPLTIPSAGLSTFPAASASGVPRTELEELQLEELRLRIGEMQERAASKKSAADQLKAQRLQVAAQIKRKIATDDLEKRVCNHLKEKGEPYTVGMRDHRGNTNVHCQKCHMNWYIGPYYTHDEQYNPSLNPTNPKRHARGLMFSPRVPGGLIPKSEFIGGPDLRVVSSPNESGQ